METVFVRFMVYIISWFIVKTYMARAHFQEKKNIKEDILLKKSLKSLSAQYDELCYDEDEIGNEIDRSVSMLRTITKQPHKWGHGDFERLSALHGFRNNELCIEYLEKNGIREEYSKEFQQYTRQ